MTDLRRTPSQPTWLTLRSGTRVRVVRHAACRVHGTQSEPITALCEMADGSCAEVHYSELKTARVRGCGAQANNYYGWKQSSDAHQPMRLEEILRWVRSAR